MGWLVPHSLWPREIPREERPWPLSPWLQAEGLKPVFPRRLTKLWKITRYSRRCLAAPVQFSQ